MLAQSGWRRAWLDCPSRGDGVGSVQQSAQALLIGIPCGCQSASRIRSVAGYWRAIRDEGRLGAGRVPSYSLGGWYDLRLGGAINSDTGVRAKGATAAEGDADDV